MTQDQSGENDRDAKRNEKGKLSPKEDWSDEKQARLERALDETRTTIASDCVVRFMFAPDVWVDTPKESRDHWYARYTPGFRKAIERGYLWEETDGHREKVLKRAEEVRHLAAMFGAIVSILAELSRAKVGGHGQLVRVNAISKPEVDPVLAELASQCIDCVQQGPNPGGVRFEFCSRADNQPPRNPPMVEVIQRLLDAAGLELTVAPRK